MDRIWTCNVGWQLHPLPPTSFELVGCYPLKLISSPAPFPKFTYSWFLEYKKIGNLVHKNNHRPELDSSMSMESGTERTICEENMFCCVARYSRKWKRNGQVSLFWGRWPCRWVLNEKCARRKYFNSNLCWMRQYVSIESLSQEFCCILTIILSDHEIWLEQSENESLARKKPV